MKKDKKTVPFHRGTVLYHNNPLQISKKVLERSGLPDNRLHDLRHSFAGSSLSARDDIKTVQTNLGHATAQFTLNVYGHATEKMRQESANRMQQFYEHLSK